MLWAGLLVLWDILDIDLSAVRTNEGSIGPIITVIKNPKAIPSVLATFVGYFLYKLVLEWAQCNSDRRGRHASILDFGTTCFVAAGAIVLYVFKIDK
jgi:hypothetical protein